MRYEEYSEIFNNLKKLDIAILYIKLKYDIMLIDSVDIVDENIAESYSLMTEDFVNTQQLTMFNEMAYRAKPNAFFYYLNNVIGIFLKLLVLAAVWYRLFYRNKKDTNQSQAVA